MLGEGRRVWEGGKGEGKEGSREEGRQGRGSWQLALSLSGKQLASGEPDGCTHRRSALNSCVCL